ncbi:MAG: TonB-dependent receptor [Pseudomonadota bacterium]
MSASAIAVAAISSSTAWAQDAEFVSDRDEIIVTAQKRAESLQDVPIAVTAISGDLLENRGIIRLDEIARLTPGFNLQQPLDARFLRLSIRGISSDTRFPGAEQSVAVVVDGVYLSGVAGVLTDLVDVEQVEILRGPQGTLFGRNATAGVVNITSRQPGSTPRAQASLEYANFDHLNLKGSVSGPIAGDVLAGQIGISHTQRDGFIDNTFLGRSEDDQDTTTLRGMLRFTPSETLEIRVNADYTDESRNPQVPDAEGGMALGLDGDPFNRDVQIDTANFADREIFGLSGTVEKFFDNGMLLRSITSYREYTVDEFLDGDFSPTFFLTRGNAESSEEFVQEVQLLSDDTGDLTWIVGGFYLSQDLLNEGDYAVNLGAFEPVFFGGSYRNFLGGVFGLPDAQINALCEPGAAPACQSVETALVDFGLDTESYALFGQATYELSDRWDVTVGARYSNDQRDYSYRSFGDEVGFPLLDPIIARLATPLTDDREDEDISFKFTTSYDVSDDLNLYASVAEGYKSGTFFTTILTSAAQFAQTPVDEENSVSYEVGAKGTIADRLRFAGAAFFYDYSDFQTDQQIPGAVPGQPTTVLGNADVETYGFEFEADARLNDIFSLAGSFAYIHSEFTNYPGCFTGVDALGTVTFEDCDGNPLPFAPEVTGSLALDFDAPVSETVNLFGFAGVDYRSRQYFTPRENELESQDGYALVNGQVGLAFGQGRYRASIWSKNLFDKDYSTFRSAGSPVPLTFALGAPRTYGIRLQADF